MTRMASAFLLAAGFGTRLQPLTHHRPKPLVPFLGLPLAEQSLALLYRHGHTEVVVNTHHLADVMDGWIRARARRDERMQLILSHEDPAILGTGGGIQKVRALLDDSFVVVNGDILCDVDLGTLKRAMPEAGAVMALRALGKGDPYSQVTRDASGVVVDLAGLASAEPRGRIAGSTHFTGVHAMTQEALECVPAEGEACVVRTAYRALVPGRRVAGVLHQGLWMDLGNPTIYLEANLLAVEGAIPLPLDTRPLAGWVLQTDREWGSPSAV